MPCRGQAHQRGRGADGCVTPLPTLCVRTADFAAANTLQLYASCYIAAAKMFLLDWFYGVLNYLGASRAD